MKHHRQDVSATAASVNSSTLVRRTIFLWQSGSVDFNSGARPVGSRLSAFWEDKFLLTRDVFSIAITTTRHKRDGGDNQERVLCGGMRCSDIRAPGIPGDRFRAALLLPLQPSDPFIFWRMLLAITVPDSPLDGQRVDLV